MLQEKKQATLEIGSGGKIKREKKTLYIVYDDDDDDVRSNLRK